MIQLFIKHIIIVLNHGKAYLNYVIEKLRPTISTFFHKTTVPLWHIFMLPFVTCISGYLDTRPKLSLPGSIFRFQLPVNDFRKIGLNI